MSVMILAVAVLSIFLIASIASQIVQAKEGVRQGNNGRCIKLQKTFPPEIQDYQGCHDTFTGPGHNDPVPLP